MRNNPLHNSSYRGCEGFGVFVIFCIIWPVWFFPIILCYDALCKLLK
jgi:hypothetical protein